MMTAGAAFGPPLAFFPRPRHSRIYYRCVDLKCVGGIWSCSDYANSQHRNNDPGSCLIWCGSKVSWRKPEVHRKHPFPFMEISFLYQKINDFPVLEEYLINLWH